MGGQQLRAVMILSACFAVLVHLMFKKKKRRTGEVEVSWKQIMERRLIHSCQDRQTQHSKDRLSLEQEFALVAGGPARLANASPDKKVGEQNNILPKNSREALAQKPHRQHVTCSAAKKYFSEAEEEHSQCKASRPVHPMNNWWVSNPCYGEEAATGGYEGLDWDSQTATACSGGVGGAVSGFQNVINPLYENSFQAVQLDGPCSELPEMPTSKASHQKDDDVVSASASMSELKTMHFGHSQTHNGKENGHRSAIKLGSSGANQLPTERRSAAEKERSHNPRVPSAPSQRSSASSANSKSTHVLPSTFVSSDLAHAIDFSVSGTNTLSSNISHWPQHYANVMSDQRYPDQMSMEWDLDGLLDEPQENSELLPGPWEKAGKAIGSANKHQFSSQAAVLVSAPVMPKDNASAYESEKSVVESQHTADYGAEPYSFSGPLREKGEGNKDADDPLFDRQIWREENTDSSHSGSQICSEPALHSSYAEKKARHYPADNSNPEDSSSTPEDKEIVTSCKSAGPVDKSSSAAGNHVKPPSSDTKPKLRSSFKDGKSKRTKAWERRQVNIFLHRSRTRTTLGEALTKLDQDTFTGHLGRTDLSPPTGAAEPSLQAKTPSKSHTKEAIIPRKPLLTPQSVSGKNKDTVQPKSTADAEMPSLTVRDNRYIKSKNEADSAPESAHAVAIPIPGISISRQRQQLLRQAQDRRNRSSNLQTLALHQIFRHRVAAAPALNHKEKHRNANSSTRTMDSRVTDSYTSPRAAGEPKRIKNTLNLDEDVTPLLSGCIQKSPTLYDHQTPSRPATEAIKQQAGKAPADKQSCISPLPTQQPHQDMAENHSPELVEPPSLEGGKSSSNYSPSTEVILGNSKSKAGVFQLVKTSLPALQKILGTREWQRRQVQVSKHYQHCCQMAEKAWKEHFQLVINWKL